MAEWGDVEMTVSDPDAKWLDNRESARLCLITGVAAGHQAPALLFLSLSSRSQLELACGTL